MECHKPKCSYISPSGAGCLAYAVKGQPYCFYHDPRPEAVAKREKSLMKGAKRQRSYEGLASWDPRKLATMEDLKAALNELFNAGILGELSTSRISALAYVANALGKVIEQSDPEELRREKEEEDEDVMPIILDVLDRYPEAKAELVNRLEEMNDHRQNRGRP